MEPEEVLDLIGDYDIVVDDSTKHVPYAMFCSTFDALDYIETLKVIKPEIPWKIMLLSDWQKQYKY